MLGSVRDLAIRAGIAPSVVASYFKGADPSRRRVIALAEAAGVLPEWLLTGDGPRDPATPPLSPVRNGIEDGAYRPLQRRLVMLPSLDARAPEGTPGLSISWLGSKYPDGQMTQLWIAGCTEDALRPVLRNGAIAVIDQSDKPKGKAVWGVWAIDHNDRIKFRRLAYRQPGRLVAVAAESDDAAQARSERDKDYPPIPIAEGSETQILGRVIWTFQPVE